jgi:S1-C subfamily serine protease
VLDVVGSMPKCLGCTVACGRDMGRIGGGSVNELMAKPHRMRSAGLRTVFGRGLCTILFLVGAAFGMAAQAAAEPVSVVMREMLSSTAQVVVVRENGARRTGSSVVVSNGTENGKALLLTAAHVLTPVEAQEIHAVTPLRRDAVPARLVAVDDDADLAILEIEAFEAKSIDFAAEASLGDQILVASFPWGGRATVVSGMVSQIDWDQSVDDSEFPFTGPASLIDATVSHGMSGGGVFNRESGTLVGIVRSHRSVNVTLPGEPKRTFTLPVAGETNVVPTKRILCFLANSGYRELISDALLDAAKTESCRMGS